MPRGRVKTKLNDTAANLGFEQKLWLAADKLRGNEEDPEPFPDKMARLTKQLEDQFAESAKMEKEIRKNLTRVRAGGS